MCTCVVRGDGGQQGTLMNLLCLYTVALPACAVPCDDSPPSHFCQKN